MFYRSAAAAPPLVVAILLAACGVFPGVADAGDCEPHPVELEGSVRPQPPAVVRVSSCALVIRVDDGEARYIHQGEWTLSDEAVAGLQPLGWISHANLGWAAQLQSDGDLRTWAIDGYDPSLGFWGTAENLRGSNTYVLWTIDDCSEVDACEPPICEFLDPAALSTREACDGRST